MKLINIGFGNLVSAGRVVAVVSPDSAPVKRLVKEARERGMLIDASYGRSTRAVLIMDSDHVVLSALQPETVDYYYRTKEQFQQLIDQDEVVEHNFFNGNYYGTLKEEVNKRLNAGKLVVMVIDVHGAANIRRMYPGATTIFLLPPSTQELERRLRGRGTETEESIQERLEIARNELAQQDKFTLKLVNDEVDACAARLYDVICQRAGLTR